MLRTVWLSLVFLVALFMLCYTHYRINRLASPYYVEDTPAEWVDEDPYGLLIGEE